MDSERCLKVTLSGINPTPDWRYQLKIGSVFPGEIRGVAGNTEKDENLLGEALGKQANFS